MKIPLPSVTSLPNPSGHSYPFQIAFRAQKFLAGSIFYYAFVDAVVGQYMQIGSQPLERVQNAFREAGVSERAWEVNWSSLEAYLEAFPNPVFQNALFSMVTHWDWYATRLGEFVEFARSHVPSPRLDKQGVAKLRRIGFRGLADQLAILREATGLSLPIHTNIVTALSEMELVRNLGMHLQWEVDDYYLRRSVKKEWSLGDVRIITPSELAEWRDGLHSVILETANSIARNYPMVPEYPVTESQAEA